MTEIAPRPVPATRPLAATVALWAGQVLFAALFMFAGLNKLFGLQQEVIDQFETIGAGVGFRYSTGALELAGGLGLLVPRLAGPAALGLIGVMAGAVVAHLTVLPPATLALAPVVLGALLGPIAWGRWPQTKALIAARKR